MQRKEVLPLLQDLITEKMFQRSSEKMGWKDAILKPFEMQIMASAL